MIHRDEHAGNFTVINNDIIDAELSDGAFRLLIYMLTCADGWKFSLRGLSYVFGVGERTISERVAELKRAGYLDITRNTDKHGRFTSSEWDVYETPVTMSQKNRNVVLPQREITATRNYRNVVLPQRGFASCHKQISIKTNTNNKQVSKGTNKKGAKIFKKPTVDEVAQYCQERKNSVNPQHFIDHYEANGWKVGKNPMKDWRAAVRTWERNYYDRPRAVTKPIEDDENVFDKIIRERGLT